MTREQLVDHIFSKGTYLCVGLDTDPAKVPSHLLGEPDPVYTFNKAIIDATRDYCVAYKINTAFYEVLGAKGWEAMEKTVQYIGKDHFTIADAKRGDIGNTSDQYAKAFFDTLPFDAVTVAPYMGADSVKPFLQYEGKWAIVLGLTSNAGARDFELQPSGDDRQKRPQKNTHNRYYRWRKENHNGCQGRPGECSKCDNYRRTPLIPVNQQIDVAARHYGLPAFSFLLFLFNHFV